MGIELSKTHTENLFISEETIARRYLDERKITLFVAQGDYDGVKRIIDDMPRDWDSYLDFLARNSNNAEQSILDAALIVNTWMRITLLQTQVPVTLLHGIATYWGRVIRSTPADQFFSGHLFENLFRSYCEISLEFNREHFSPTVDRIVNYIFYHLSSQITLAQISKEFNYSSVYINRLLKNETGYSTVQYIKQKRISLAKTLLKLDEISLEDVAVSVGYVDYNYFCRVFKQVVQMSPAQYRENLLNNAK